MKKHLGKILSLVLVVVTAVSCAIGLTACGEKKYKAGFQSSTTSESYISGNADMNFAGYGNIQGQGFDNFNLAVDQMLAGTIDFCVSDNDQAMKVANSPIYKGKVKVIDIALSQEEYAVGVDKNQPKLVEAANKVIKEKGKQYFMDLCEKFSKPDYVPTADETFDISKEINTANPETQLVVATNAEFAPFEYFVGADSEMKVTGVDMVLASLIAKELNQELVIQHMEFEAIISSVGKNGVDISVAGLSVTNTRKQAFNFSDTYYSGSYQVIVVKADDTTFDNCKTKADVENVLKGLTK